MIEFKEMKSNLCDRMYGAELNGVSYIYSFTRNYGWSASYQGPDKRAEHFGPFRTEGEVLRVFKFLTYVVIRDGRVIDRLVVQPGLYPEGAGRAAVRWWANNYPDADLALLMGGDDDAN